MPNPVRSGGYPVNGQASCEVLQMVVFGMLFLQMDLDDIPACPEQKGVVLFAGSIAAHPGATFALVVILLTRFMSEDIDVLQ